MRNVDLDTALVEARERYANANPKSAALHAQACEVLPGGNTRSILHYAPFPLVISAAEGATAVDADGHRYTDFLGEYTAGLFGHSHPRIQAAVVEALQRGTVLCAPNEDEARLAAILFRR